MPKGNAQEYNTSMAKLIWTILRESHTGPVDRLDTHTVSRKYVQSCNREELNREREERGEEEGDKSSFPRWSIRTTDRPTDSDLRRWRRFRYFWLLLLLLRNNDGHRPPARPRRSR